MPHFKSLLVAVDFSGPSIEALKAAANLCSKLGAELKVVYVAKMDESEIMGANSDDSETTESKLLNTFESELATMTDHIAHHEITCSAQVVFGEPDIAIKKAAEESGVDMIVIGTHGRTGLAHLLMGSVAESVLQSTTLPVMCVRT